MSFELTVRRTNVAGEIEIAHRESLDGVIESALRQSGHGEQAHSESLHVVLRIHLFILHSLLEFSV
jgi:hypothetical protein